MGNKFTTFMLLTLLCACQSQAPQQQKMLVNIVNKDGTPIDTSPSAGVSSSQAVITASSPELMQDIKTGAIKSGNLYYMPIGRDNTGCKYYSSFAPGKVTLTAVYYKKSDASFTNNRAEAVCD